jgi:NitT/TauT family transport system permease protein
MASAQVEAKVDARAARPAAPRPRTAGSWWRDNERAILGWLSFGGFFVFWEVGADVGLFDTFFFSSPLRILAAGFHEVQNPRLWNDFKVSGTEFLSGYALAIVTGIPLGIAVGWYRKLNYFIDPWLNFFNSIPRIALLPLVVLWVGIGIWSKILVVMLGAFFTLIMTTLGGVRATDKRLLDAATSFGASQWRIFGTVVLPATVPYIISGLRLGVARALIGVIVGELYAANAGIGYMISIASQTLQVDRMLFGVLILTGFGVVSVELIRLIENRFQRWRPAVGAR